MITMRSRLPCFGFAAPLLLAFVYMHSHAQTSDSAADRLRLGARVAANGSTNGAVACARCHGFDGAADGSGAFPMIAGQSAMYLNRQLQAYASGARDNAIMSNIARHMSPQEMDAVSIYYETRRPDLPVQRTHDASVLRRGEVLAFVGQLSPRVQACISCHGPQGKGEPPTVPYLAGQYQHYIQVQLEAYRRGYRVNPQMTTIGHNLSKEDAAAVAAYFDQLPFPTPAPESTYGTVQRTASTRTPGQSR